MPTKQVIKGHRGRSAERTRKFMNFFIRIFLQVNHQLKRFCSHFCYSYACTMWKKSAAAFEMVFAIGKIQAGAKKSLKFAHQVFCCQFVGGLCSPLFLLYPNSFFTVICSGFPPVWFWRLYSYCTMTE